MPRSFDVYRDKSFCTAKTLDLFGQHVELTLHLTDVWLLPLSKNHALRHFRLRVRRFRRLRSISIGLRTFARDYLRW